MICVGTAKCSPQTREELKIALEEQIRSFHQDRGGDLRLDKLIAWNHAEFEVTYPSLNAEIRIGDYYLRLLLEEDALFQKSSGDSDKDAGDGEAEGKGARKDSAGPVVIKDSLCFFNDLYHRFLLTSDTGMRCLCLQAMAVVYGRCFADIGPFNDTKYIVNMLAKVRGGRGAGGRLVAPESGRHG